MNLTVKAIQPSGVLNGSQGSNLRQEIDALLASGAEVVLVNLQDVTFVDSSGLGALVMAFKSARAAGSRLCFCSVGEQPKMLFELTGMEQVFDVFSDPDEFHKTLAASGASFHIKGERVA